MQISVMRGVGFKVLSQQPGAGGVDRPSSTSRVVWAVGPEHVARI